MRNKPLFNDDFQGHDEFPLTHETIVDTVGETLELLGLELNRVTLKLPHLSNKAFAESTRNAYIAILTASLSEDVDLSNMPPGLRSLVEDAIESGDNDITITTYCKQATSVEEAISERRGVNMISTTPSSEKVVGML